MPKRGGLVRNLFHLGVGQVATTALAMVLSAVVARTLGAADYGLLYLLTSIATFAYVFVDWGHGPYVTREVAIRPHRSGEMMGSVLVVRAATALLMCGVAFLATWLLGYDLWTRLLAVLLILAWMPQYLGLSYTWVFRGRERMEFDALLQVVLKFATLIIAFTCIALGGRLVALIAAAAIAGTITLVTGIVLYRRLGFPPLRFTRASALELVTDGAPMLAISLAVAAQPSIDANILYRFVPQEVLGWYGATWTIAGTLVAPATILGAAMYPRLSRAAHDRAEFSRVLRIAFRPLLLIALLGSVGTYLFADVAIGLIYSQKQYGPAGEILRALALFLMLIYVDMLFGHAIVAVRKAGQLAKAKVVAVIVTTAIELALIPYFQARISNGGVGIVLALACGELVMIGASLWLLREFLSRAMLADVGRGLTAGVLTIGAMELLPALTPFIAIPLCIVLFAVLAVLLGSVTPDDVQLLTASFGQGRGAAPEPVIAPGQTSPPA
jgi:O-antigen/teichoic acid export membrane protein